MAKVSSSQTLDYSGGDSLGFLIYGAIIAFLKDDFSSKNLWFTFQHAMS